LTRKAADDVMEKINEIGEVTLDSKTAIEAARAAYNALTPDQKPLVENYNVLTDAEAELARLEAEAKYEADLAAAAAGGRDDRAPVPCQPLQRPGHPYGPRCV